LTEEHHNYLLSMFAESIDAFLHRIRHSFVEPIKTSNL
jgi:hypothetical protein